MVLNFTRRYSNVKRLKPILSRLVLSSFVFVRVVCALSQVHVQEERVRYSVMTRSAVAMPRGKRPCLRWYPTATSNPCRCPLPTLL